MSRRLTISEKNSPVAEIGERARDMLQSQRLLSRI